MPKADAVPKNMKAVYVSTDSGLLHGHIHLHPGKRVTDEMNHGEPYFALTNATIYDDDGSVLDQSPFMAINKAKVIWVRPDEEG